MTLERYIDGRSPVLTPGALVVPVAMPAADALAQLATRPPGTALLAADAQGTVLGRVDVVALAAAALRTLRLVTDERDAARRALAEADARSRAMLANISHEIRTPLSAVACYSELMLEDGQTPLADKHRNYVQAMHTASDHMVGVLEAVLDLARLGAEEAPLSCSLVDVRALMTQVASMLQSDAEAQGVRLSVRPRRSLPLLHADARMLRQILINLVSNAIKYGGAGGVVLLTASVGARGALRLEVRDRGSGMAPSAIEQAMQPFMRLHDGFETAHRGAGLGLPMVKAMAELHDGSFQLVSAQGQGTRAIVTLPAARVRRSDGSKGQAEFEFVRPAHLLSA